MDRARQQQARCGQPGGRCPQRPGGERRRPADKDQARGRSPWRLGSAATSTAAPPLWPVPAAARQREPVPVPADGSWRPGGLGWPACPLPLPSHAAVDGSQAHGRCLRQPGCARLRPPQRHQRMADLDWPACPSPLLSGVASGGQGGGLVTLVWGAARTSCCLVTRP